ncbi:MAG: ABC transporter permease [Lachnospiraceae bacterium]|nr:ABC transporter permease [Lachnospiraceae bacterium]
MSGIFVALQGAVAQGILWGVMVLGVYITYRLLNIADLTVDGSFALGGCVCATLIINFNMDPVLALVIAALAGMLAGAVTGFLHTVLEIPAILAGILTQISLWSVNLRIMSGKSNIPLLKLKTLISGVGDSLGLSQAQASILVGILIALLMVTVLYWFFGTELGSSIRATGYNEDMIRALGVNTGKMKLLGLMISNSLVSLSGALVCQHQKYADINMGRGAIVIGLAAIVIGEVLLSVAGGLFAGKLENFAFRLSAVVLGSAAYFLIRAIVLQLGLKTNDMNLFTAVFVALALSIPVLTAKWRAKQAYSETGEGGA